MTTYYKFFSLKGKKKQHALDAIKHTQLYMSPYLNQRGVNDAEEGVYYLDSSIEQYLRDKVKANKEAFLICSAALHYRNVHLWNKFANKSKGICIAFEYIYNSEIEKTIIKYLDKHPYLSPNVYRALPSRTIAKFVLSHKLSKFRKEDEIRFFKHVNDNICSAFLKVKIKYICIGRNITAKNEREVRAAAAKRNIRVIKQI
jgi:hypothetical protein